MNRRALITGITGQDGYYLARLLLEKGYDVCGVVRPGGTPNLERLAPLVDRVTLQTSLVELVARRQPDEVYNLAGKSFVPDSWADPVEAGNVMGLGVARLLEAIRQACPTARFCQASSSEIFGDATAEPQSETTPIRPRNPYGAAKAYAHWLVGQYRGQHGLFACAAIMFNHESPLRNKRFVTRKITDAAARIKLGLVNRLPLGDLEARRDWGFAGDFMRAMWMMLQRDEPDDFVIATGKTHTVRKLLDLSFDRVGLDYGDFVSVEANLIRPPDAVTLRGDFTKAREVLGWEPQVSLAELMEMMVDADLEFVKRKLQAEA
jgi:GDPmannose 4,6-dehydratase